MKNIDSIGDFVDKDSKGIIPSVLSERYDIDTSVWRYKPSLSLNDAAIVIKLFALNIFYPAFVLKCMLKIGMYSSFLKKYNPQRIVVHNEYSYTSSILTWYCNKNGVDHINVMHGDKFFDLRDSFFHFTKCYVWDEFYKRLFIQLRAEPSQFEIAVPPALKIETEKFFNQKYYATYKYYLAIFTEEEIQSVVKSMEFTKQRGETVMYRPHPRYSDLTILKKYVPECEIEYPEKVPFYESVSSLNYAVGSFTTVLIQAFLSGKGVICDDVTFKGQYDKLSELNFIMANYSLPKLSDFNKVN